MVQGKKTFNNSKPKFAEVVIGDSEAKEMREAANGRPSRSPYLGSTNLRQVFDNQEINMKNICSVQIK